MKMLTGHHHRGRALWALSCTILFMAFLATPGCSSLWKAREKVVVEYCDSTVVEIHERIIHDTAWAEIPVYIEKNVTKDDSSHLENPYAISDAVVKDGLLHHTLQTKPQSIAAPIDIPVADTTTTHQTQEKEEETTTKIQYVEKKLSAWQRFRIGSFWWLLALAAVGWRKQILWLIKKVAGMFG